MLIKATFGFTVFLFTDYFVMEVSTSTLVDIIMLELNRSCYLIVVFYYHINTFCFVKAAATINKDIRRAGSDISNLFC